MADNRFVGTKSVSKPRNTNKFQDLSVAIITERDDHGAELIRGVQKSRANVNHIWPMPSEIPTDFDMVFCNLVDDLPSRFDGIPGNVDITFVVVIPARGVMNEKALIDSVPHAVLHLPCRPEEVISTMIVARSNHRYERCLHQRIEKLDDNLRSMKTIERAKVIVMQSNNVNEEEAYKHLRHKAMQRRVTIGVLASSIVDSQELLG